MTTTVSVPLVRRPLSWDMFADIVDDVAVVKLNAAGIVFDGWLSPAQLAKVRIRLMTADADEEQTILKAHQALSGNSDFLALDSPTSAQAVKQVQALTRQVDALIKFVLQLDS